jgi:hypothetical protein
VISIVLIYRLRFAELGWSVSIFWVWYEKYYVVTFYLYILPDPDRDLGRVRLPVFLYMSLVLHLVRYLIRLLDNTAVQGRCLTLPHFFDSAQKQIEKIYRYRFQLKIKLNSLF